MNLLGIMYSTNSTAAIMCDGEIIACAGEDRFARRKSLHAYPQQAIEFCLAQAGLSPRDIDLVALPYEGMFTNFDRLLVDYDGSFSVREKFEEQYRYYKPLLLDGQRPNFLEIFKRKIIPERWQMAQTEPDGNYLLAALRQHLGIAPNRVRTYPHHLTHLYYALYSQRTFRDPVLIFGMEGWGGDRNASIARYAHGAVDTLMHSAECCLGRLYRYITLLLGMQSNQHEYKVMGLAPYVSARTIQRALEVFRATMYVDGIEFKYHEKPPDMFFYFKERLESERFDAIAGALQRYTEEIIVAWVRNAIRQFGISDILFTGGVAMNIKAMMEVAKLSEVRSLWVGATPSDESLAMGTLWLAHPQISNAPLKPLRNVYLGNAYAEVDIERFLCRIVPAEGFRVRANATPDEVAQCLDAGLVIARFAGRAEFGARALGNRSILADPRRPAMIRRMNEKIKNRDFWMPFAPVLLQERQHDYLINPKRIESPYMTIGFETLARAREELPAAIHPHDFTARPQILSRSDNPAYYDIVKAFERRTGVGGLLNTSFNLHGEPIVCTLEDAWRVFTVSGLDGLVLGSWLIEKAAMPAIQLAPTTLAPLLEGPRLLLRPMLEQDVTQEYLRWLNDPEVTRYLEVGKRPVGREEALKYLGSFGQGQGWLLAIVERGDGRLIGTVNLRLIDGTRTGETGLMIGEQTCWGKGYAAETWRLLLGWAFDVAGLESITAGAVMTHAASRKVLERLGFREEGRRRKHGPNFEWDTMRYRLRRGEWRG